MSRGDCGFARQASDVISVRSIEIPTGPPEARHAAMYEVVTQVVPQFRDAATVDFKSSILSGGATNELFKVTRISTGEAVVFRVYGQGTDQIIERDSEVFWQEQFLRTYGRCRNGLVYEFLAGFQPLQPNELPAEVERIARNLADLHVTATLRSLFAFPYATDATNHTQFVLADWTKTAFSSQTWALLHGRYGGDPDKAARLNYYRENETKIRGFVDTLLNVITMKVSPWSPQVPCHNDLLGLNIMVDKQRSPGDDEAMRFIDFEYMRRNYCYFDAANHFNEYCGMECDWSKYPDAAIQRRFLSAYLRHAKQLSLTSNLTVDASRWTATAPSTAGCVVSDRDVAVACALTNVLSLASNVKWGVWSVIQASTSVIDFDYLSYGKMRLQRAFDTSDTFFSQLDAALQSDE